MLKAAPTWLLAPLLGCALTFAAFWPGWMSLDSAWQYSQALSGRYDDISPPLFALVWSWTERLLPGPGGLYALLVGLFWFALAALLRPLLAGWRHAVAVLGVGLLPPVFIVLAHLWKDVALAGAMLAACAALLRWRHGGSRLAWAGTLVALLAAVLLRHNALPAAVPLLAWLLWPRAAAEPTAVASPARSGLRLLAGGLLLGALALAPGALLRLLDGAPKHPWTATALWDIAAVSIATGQQLIPAPIVDPRLDVATLEKYFVPWGNATIFDSNMIRLSFFVDYTPAMRSAVLQRWLSLPLEFPAAYLRHRARLAGLLLLGPPPDAPHQLVYVQAQERLPPAAPASAAPPNALSQAVVDFVERTRRQFWYWSGCWLGIAGLAALYAWPRRHGSQCAAASLLLAASAWLYFLPLLLVSGGVELRYLLWTHVAAALAGVLALATWRERRPDPA